MGRAERLNAGRAEKLAHGQFGEKPKPRTQKYYFYHLVFQYQVGGQVGVRRIEAAVNAPITLGAQLAQLEANLAKTLNTEGSMVVGQTPEVTVISFQLLREALVMLEPEPEEAAPTTTDDAPEGEPA